MAGINIEVNIEEDKWNSEIPDAEEIITKASIAALCGAGIYNRGRNIEVSVLLTNDKSIKKLNSDYRYKNKPTNVLSFPQEEFVAGEYDNAGTEISLGDVIFAIETIQKESEEQGKPVDNHLAHLSVHGTLHLLGFDHEEDLEAEIMEALEVKILKSIGIENPYLDNI